MAERLPLRCAVVPPAPAPYREPLFRALAERLELSVIYQSRAQPSWDQASNWSAKEHEYPAIHLRSWQHARPGRTPIVWSRGLERALRRATPGCVVVSEYGPVSLRVLAWCRRHARAYVIFTECTSEINRLLSPAQLALHRRLARHADGVIAVSSRARARLEAFGVPSDRITVALQAADLEPVRAARMGRQRDRGRPLTVLGVARLVPDKNLAALITAFAATGLGPDDARLRIIGSGFLEADLRRLAERLRVPAQFAGAVAPGRIAAEYAGADVFALVSGYEPFGVAFREAAAAGLPIVASQVAGAVGDVAIGERNAILVDPERIDQITAALARLLRDATLRERMSVESLAIDRATDGHDVDAFAGAVGAATRRAQVGAAARRARGGHASADGRR